jgi:hypothetical protein
VNRLSPHGECGRRSEVEVSLGKAKENFVVVNQSLKKDRAFFCPVFSNASYMLLFNNLTKRRTKKRNKDTDNSLVTVGVFNHKQSEI